MARVRNTQDLQEKNQSIAGTLFVFLGFGVFVLVFASLGNNDSFRETRLEASVWEASPWGLSETNQKFIDTYMPYFPVFALHYTKPE